MRETGYFRRPAQGPHLYGPVGRQGQMGQRSVEDMVVNNIEIFLRDFGKELEGDNAAVFAGAGLSRPAGFVDWKNLLRQTALDLGLDVDKEYNLVALAQYHCNERCGNRAHLNEILLEEFSKDAEITANHRILARLPIHTFWTTNYDKLIEWALEDAGKRADVKYTVEQLALTRPRRDAVVYKMHGDIEHPDSAVLTKDDYERYHLSRAPFVSALTGDLVSRTFLFLGFSFTDPNLDYVLGRIRATYEKNMRAHYCFMKRLDEGECPDRDTFQYRVRQQEFFINDLKRFNIYTVLLDRYDQTTEVLGRLERNYKAKTVFISGAIAAWDEVWPRDRARDFAKALSRRLVDKGYRVVCGFGQGVGSAVISGALEHIYAKKRGKMEDQLVLRPFPHDSGRDDYADLLRRYREDMADYAGVAVFLFGNKERDGQIVLSDGVEQEFEICHDKGLAVLPVGATGAMAEKLWGRMMENLKAYFPQNTEKFRDPLVTLGNRAAEPDTLINAVFQVLDLWGRG